MKQIRTGTLAFTAVLLGLFMLSCTNDALEPRLRAGDGINIIIGDHLLIASDDIAWYDSSSRQFYLNKSVEAELEQINYTKYWIVNNGAIIFEGMFNDCKPCDGPYTDSLLIYNRLDMADFVVKLERSQCWYMGDPLVQDPRNSPQLIDALKQNGQLKKGLSLTIENLVLKNDSVLNIRFLLHNNDDWNYYVLKPNILTDNGLYDNEWRITLIDSKNEKYWRSINDYNRVYKYGSNYDIDKLLLLKTGETYQYEKEYTFRGPIEPGSYSVYYKYPGLGVEFKTIDETLLGDGHIWLGNNENLVEIEIAK